MAPLRAARLKTQKPVISRAAEVAKAGEWRVPGVAAAGRTSPDSRCTSRGGAGGWLM